MDQAKAGENGSALEGRQGPTLKGSNSPVVTSIDRLLQDLSGSRCLRAGIGIKGGGGS